MKVVDTAEGTGIHREKSCSSRIGMSTITAIVFDIYRDGAISHSRVQRETINEAVRAETNRGERVSATSSPSGRRRNLIKRLLAACRCLSTFRHPPDTGTHSLVFLYAAWGTTPRNARKSFSNFPKIFLLSPRRFVLMLIRFSVRRIDVEFELNSPSIFSHEFDSINADQWYNNRRGKNFSLIPRTSSLSS